MNLFDYYFIFILFVFGSAFGSFALVMVDRMYREESFLRGRSYCDSCKHQLGALDLIPIISFLFLRGKCRYCKKSLSIGLLSTELFFGVFSALLGYLYYSYFLNSNIWSVENIISIIWFSLVLIVIFSIFLADLKYMIIMDWQFYSLVILYVLGFILFYTLKINHLSFFYIDILNHLIGGFIMFTFFGLLVLLSKERLMGQGDIYLAAIMGMFLGWQLSVVMWFLSFLIGALFGILLIIGRLKKFKSAVPFGPFLIIGFFISLFFGEILLQYYLMSLGF